MQHRLTMYNYNSTQGGTKGSNVVQQVFHNPIGSGGQTKYGGFNLSNFTTMKSKQHKSMNESKQDIITTPIIQNNLKSNESSKAKDLNLYTIYK